MTAATQPYEEPAGARRVAVVGAGLAGLRAAWALARRGCDVVVLEQRGRVGGKAASEVVDGFTVDRALPVLSFEDARLLAWIAELGLASIVFPMRALSVMHLHAGKVVPIATGSLTAIAGIPGVRLRDAFRLLRLPRLLRRYAPLLDASAPERAADLDYRSVADFARLYFGRSVLEHFVAPIVTAATLGDEEELSRVAFLQLWHASREGEATFGIAATGLHEIAEGAAAKLAVRTHAKVVQLKELAAGFSIGLRTDAGDETLEVDAVVLATGANEAGRIAAGVATTAERELLARVRGGPLVTLVLALERPATGVPQLLRVPHTERSPIEVLLSEPGVQAGRAPDRCGLITLSATRAFATESAELSAVDVERALRDALIRIHPSVERSVRFSRLHRDPEGVPRFEVGVYRDLARFARVQADRRSLGRRLYYAGDYLAGPRVEDAVLSGLRAAEAAQGDR